MPTSAAPPPLRLGRILVVDDDDDVREIVRRILSKNGFEVLCAGTGTEALRLWQDTDQVVDALITDVVMPGMSGRQLAERLHQDRRGLPTLYMSGYTADTFPAGQMPDADTALIHKPFDSATLLAAVRRILDRATTERR